MTPTPAQRKLRDDMLAAGGYAEGASESAVAAIAAEVHREILQVVTVGHVDHGKSTLVGRLLCDTGTIPPAKVEAVRKLCESQGKRFEHAFLLDALEAEREQGITIDSARCFFRSKLRDYILVDAPGHVEFIRNMVSGAARTEAALLLLDANEGIRENSRRHGKLLSLLGVRQMVVVVNKLDLLDFDQGRYQHLVDSYGEFLASCGITASVYVPVSARHGDNVVEPSENLSWYQGPTLLQALDALVRPPRPDEGPLRMPVQDVYKFNRQGNDERLTIGRVASGVLRVGDEVVFSPSGKRSRVKALRAFAADEPEAIHPGDNATVSLADELYINRGELMHRPEEAPDVGRVLSGRIFWLGRKPLRTGAVYGLRMATSEMEAEVLAVPSTTDAASLQTLYDASQVERNQIADVQLRLVRPMALDIDGVCAETKRFVLLDGYDIAGGGQVTQMEPLPKEGRRAVEFLDEFRWRDQHVPAAEWTSRHGHQSALVLIVGEVGLGKGQLAAALQRTLFDAGLNAVLLDCDNVLEAAPHDTSIETAHGQLADQLLRTVKPMLDAGLVVVATSKALGLADHGFLREAMPGRQLTVLLSPDRNARLVDADLQVFGHSAPGQTQNRLRDAVLELVQADQG